MRRARPIVISGVITGVVMATISFFIEDPTQSRGTLVAGLVAAVTIVAIPIYDIDRWPLARRTLVHFLVMLVTVFPLLLWSGWFSVSVSIGVFLLFGLVGWTAGYLVHRTQRRKAERASSATSNQ